MNTYVYYLLTLHSKTKHHCTVYKTVNNQSFYSIRFFLASHNEFSAQKTNHFHFISKVARFYRPSKSRFSTSVLSTGLTKALRYTRRENNFPRFEILFFFQSYSQVIAIRYISERVVHSQVSHDVYIDRVPYFHVILIE